MYVALGYMIRRDAVEALSAEIKSLLTGPLKGRRTGVAELRKKMEAQSDAQVSLRGGVRVWQSETVDPRRLLP